MRDRFQLPRFQKIKENLVKSVANVLINKVELKIQKKRRENVYRQTSKLRRQSIKTEKVIVDCWWAFERNKCQNWKRRKRWKKNTKQQMNKVSFLSRKPWSNEFFSKHDGLEDTGKKRQWSKFYNQNKIIERKVMKFYRDMK